MRNPKAGIDQLAGSPFDIFLLIDRLKLNGRETQGVRSKLLWITASKVIFQVFSCKSPTPRKFYKNLSDLAVP